MSDPRTTGYLSTFDPPPEDPLYEGGKWHKAITNRDNPNDLDMRKLVSGVATNQAHGTTLSGPIGRSFWTPQTFEGDTEVWGSPRGGQLGAALESWRLFMWSNPMFNAQGYLVYIGGGLSKNTVIRRYDSSDDFTDIASMSAGYANGLLMKTVGADIEVWAVDFGFSENNPANWYRRLVVTDNTYRGPWFIGMGIEDPTNGGLSWTAFGGGQPLRKQIFRHVSN